MSYFEVVIAFVWRDLGEPQETLG